MLTPTTPQEINLIAEQAWAARRSGALVNTERIQVLKDYANRYKAPAYSAIAGLFECLSDYYSNQYDAADAMASQVQEDILQACSPLWQARMYYIMGLVASSKNKLPTALSHWKEGLALAETLDDLEVKGYLIYNIADINRAIFKRYDLAKSYYKKGLQLCTSSDKHILCGLMLIGLSRCEYLENNINLSLTHAERALDLSLSSKDDRVIGICYEFAGSRYEDLKQFDKALQYLQSSLANREARQDLYGLVNSHCALSKCYLSMGLKDKALYHIQRSEEIYKTLNTHVLDDLIYLQRAHVHEALEAWQLASQYYRAHAEAKNASMTKELEDLMAVMAAELQVETAKRDAEIYRLKNVALQEKNAEITELAAELEQALEDLKLTQTELVRTSRLSGLLTLISGLAHQINTPLGNSITLASYLESLLSGPGYGTSPPSNLEQPPVQNPVQNHVQNLVQGHLHDLTEKDQSEIDQSLQHLIANLNKVAVIVESLKKFNIAPEHLYYQEASLYDFLTDWALDIQIEFPRLKVNLNFELNGTDWSLCRFEAQSMTRILREIALNALQHAYAPQEKCPLILTLKKEPNSLILSVADQGMGMVISEGKNLFEPFETLKQATSGLGLGLHLVYLLTVNVLQGEVHLYSSPQESTQVVISLPVKD